MLIEVVRLEAKRYALPVKLGKRGPYMVRFVRMRLGAGLFKRRLTITLVV